MFYLIYCGIILISFNKTYGSQVRSYDQVTTDQNNLHAANGFSKDYAGYENYHGQFNSGSNKNSGNDYTEYTFNPNQYSSNLNDNSIGYSTNYHDEFQNNDFNTDPQQSHLNSHNDILLQQYRYPDYSSADYEQQDNYESAQPQYYSQAIHTGNIPANKHIETIQHYPVPVVRNVQVPTKEPVDFPIPHPIIVPIAKPVPIQIPVSQNVQVPIEKELRIPIERIVPYAVEKNVPYHVDKFVPYPVIKYMTVKVPKPFPVKVPVFKTIIHRVKSKNW